GRPGASTPGWGVGMTADPRKVLGVLQDARELVRGDWGNSNEHVDANGMHCASVGIKRASGGPLALMAPEVMAAHVAFLRAVDVPVSAEDEEVLATVYLWNDSQASVDPVLAGFDKAIANLEAELEPTPQADATLAVMAACDQAGEVIARQI